MVGVPGRSKGCATCRRRRKGCDLQKPVCGQCCRGRLECTGWTRERVFVNATQSNSVASYNATSPNADTRGLSVALSPTMTASAYQEQYMGMFWALYQPPGVASEARILREYAAGTWTAVAGEIYHNRPAVRMALLAHCLAAVGRSENRRSLMWESLKFYTAALGRTRSDLMCPDGWKDDGVVVTSRALSSYEILYGQEPLRGSPNADQAKNWQAYNLGDESLLLKRGPWMHQQGAGFRLFVDGRMQLLISATMRRKRTFLAEEDWKSIPWLLRPKTTRDRLLDVIVDVPGLLEELDIFCALQTPEQFRILMDVLENLEERLASWYEIEAPVSSLEKLQVRGFETATRGDFAVAEIMTIYWTMCLLTCSTLHIALYLSPTLAETSPIVGRLTSLSRSNPRQYCTSIADTVGIFFQPLAGAMFAKSAAFPVGVCLGYFISTEGLSSKEAETLLGYFSQGNQGKAMGAFIKGTVKEWGPDFPKSKERNSKGRTQWTFESDSQAT